MWKRILTAILTLSIFMGVSCDESLPPYEDPANVLLSTNDALYVVSPTDNSFKAFVYLVNVYDETFEDRAVFDGAVTISLARDPTFRKTFFVSLSNILSGKYNTSSQQLRIDPGDTLKLIFSWNFVDDSGRNIRDFVEYRADRTCRQRFVSEPLNFTIRSEVKVFDKIPFTIAPTFSYTLEHHREYVPSRDCTPL